MRRLRRGAGGAPADGDLTAEARGYLMLVSGCLWRSAALLVSCST